MPCCGAEPAGAPAILTQRAARGESGRLWRRSSRACRRRLRSGKLSLPSGKVFSQQAERRGRARLAANAANLSVQNSRDLDTNKDYDTGGRHNLRRQEKNGARLGLRSYEQSEFALR